jgi:hypothetical protein
LKKAVLPPVTVPLIIPLRAALSRVVAAAAVHLPLAAVADQLP